MPYLSVSISTLKDIVEGTQDKYDFEMDSKPPEEGGETLCGKLGRKHRMRRFNSMDTHCIYPECDGRC